MGKTLQICNRKTFASCMYFCCLCFPSGSKGRNESAKSSAQSFILSQIALTGLPLGLFVVMTITVVVFSLLGALILGLLGALVFIVITVGFALLILLPTVFITTFAAVFIWLWGVGAYYIVKWFNQKDIPGIHTSWKEGLSGLTDGLGGLGSGERAPKEEANGAPNKGGADHEEDDEYEEKGAVQKKRAEKRDREGKNGPVDDVSDKVPQDKVKDVGKKAGVDTENLDPKKAADVGKVAGKTGDVKKATEGVTGNLL